MSSVEADDGHPLVSSSTQTLANYQLQYAALKERLHQLGDRRFVVWTAPALLQSHTDATQAGLARSFAASVAPLVARRIIDVIEGRGDVGSVTGQ